MPQVKLYLRSLNAKDAINNAISFANTGVIGNTLTIKITTNVGPEQTLVQYGNGSYENQLPAVDQYIQQIEQSQIDVICERLTITLHQYNYGHHHATISYTAPASGAPYAQIELDHFNPSQINNLIPITNAISSSFNVYSQSDHLILEALPQAQKESFAYHQAVTTNLREQVARIAAFNLEQTKKQDEFFMRLAETQAQKLREHEERLEEQFRERQAGLDQERATLAEQHQDRIEELEKREEEHKRKVAEFDAKENMVVRRKLLTEMISVIEKQKSFELSSKTGEKRRLVHILCGGALALSVSLIAFSARAVLTSADPHWFQFTPLTAGILFFVSTAVYYIKWNDQWFREHARAEFQNKKLNADILRASWLAELYFEGNDKDRKLPEALVNRFSEGLFLDAAANATEHPTDQLVDLVKKLSTVKVGKEGVEVTKSSAKES